LERFWSEVVSFPVKVKTEVKKEFLVFEKRRKIMKTVDTATLKGGFRGDFAGMAETKTEFFCSRDEKGTVEVRSDKELVIVHVE